MVLQILQWSGVLILALLIAGFTIYKFFPGTLLGIIQATAARRSRLTKKRIDVDGQQIHYYDGGNVEGATLVLLHGLGDEKNTFVTSVPEIAKTYRIILPDLAGHGENPQIDGKDYSIKGQVEFLDRFLNAIGVHTLYIGGNSMGGHVAAAYACRHPEHVKGLILLNATGMQLDRDSVYLYYPETVDMEFITEMFGRVFVKPPKIPKPIMEYMIAELNPRVPFFNRLIAEVENGEDFRLDEKVTGISVPALVLWGKEDPVVPLIYAEAFDRNLPNSTLRVIDGAGHSPQFEVPKVIQSEILGFLTSH